MTDVGTTKRKAMTPARRLKIWEQHGGRCCLCDMPIDGVREPWTVEHLVCLGLSGKDEDANCAPAHEACRRDKDKLDLAAIAKAKRAKRKHIGLKAKTQPIHSAGFAKKERPERPQKPVLPPRPLFR